VSENPLNKPVAGHCPAWPTNESFDGQAEKSGGPAYNPYYREALARERQALTIHQRELGVGHPHALRSLKRVARWTGQTGDLRMALQLSQVLLTYVQRVHGADHPHTLTTRGNIAAWTGQTGDAREALRLFQALLPDLRRVHGADHPDTLATWRTSRNSKGIRRMVSPRWLRRQRPLKSTLLHGMPPVPVAQASDISIAAGH
jgi:hypothetical protein